MASACRDHIKNYIVHFTPSLSNVLEPKWSLQWNFLPAKMTIGVLIKVLHKTEGHIVTCETNTGKLY